MTGRRRRAAFALLVGTFALASSAFVRPARAQDTPQLPPPPPPSSPPQYTPPPTPVQPGAAPPPRREKEPPPRREHEKTERGERDKEHEREREREAAARQRNAPPPLVVERGKNEHGHLFCLPGGEPTEAVH